MPSCWPISSAPTAIVSAPCSRRRMTRAPCGPSCAAATISSPSAWRWPINCAPSSSASGPAPLASLPTSIPRSPWRSSPAIRPPRAPRAWAKNAWLTSSLSTPTAAAAGRATCSPACTRRPSVRWATPEAEAAGDLVRGLVAVLTPLVAQIQQLAAAIAAVLQHHPDAPIVQTFPRSGTVNAAQILAELGDDRRRFTSAEQLAAEAGVAPVTHASGKHHGVTFRWACNKRLRSALTTFSDTPATPPLGPPTFIAGPSARGCDHPHAVRILARAWVRVLWRCWQNRTPYEPAQHRAAAALAA